MARCARRQPGAPATVRSDDAGYLVDVAAGDAKCGVVAADGVFVGLSDDPGARSVNLMFLAAIAADLGDFDGAVRQVKAAGAAAAESGDPVRILYAAGHAARIHLMMGDPSAARAEIGTTFAAAQGTMLALRPWSMTMLAEVELAEQHFDAARRAAKEAATLAATTNIAYQRALACRAIGLVECACGDYTAADAHLTEALTYARRQTGEGYIFHRPVAFTLDSLAEVTAVHDPPASRRWASALLNHATAIGMEHFAARARERLAELS